MLSPVEVRYWHVYKITNPLGQVYIGRTDTPERRYKAHLTNCKAFKSPLVEASVQKHSAQSHSFEVIDSFYGTIDYAHGKEAFWVRTYMSNVNQWPEMHGLNMTSGGGSVKGYKFQSEVVEARAIKNRGLKRTPEQNAANSARQKGRKLPEALVIKCSIARQKPVLVYDISMNFINEFPSIKDACASLGITQNGHVTEVLRDERWMYKKHIFKFK